jgi:hypothetical protein
MPTPDELAAVPMQTLSPWQKKRCLWCPEPATVEAVAQRDNFTARIRCCDAAYCVNKSKGLALASLPLATGTAP